MKAEIIGQKKGFQPVTLQIQIETEEDLIKLLCVFNQSRNELVAICNKYSEGFGGKRKYEPDEMKSFDEIWTALNKLRNK